MQAAAELAAETEVPSAPPHVPQSKGLDSEEKPGERLLQLARAKTDLSIPASVRGESTRAAARAWGGWALAEGGTPLGAFERRIREHEKTAEKFLKEGRPVGASAECSAGLDGCRRLESLLADGVLDSSLAFPSETKPPRSRLGQARARLRTIRGKCGDAIAGSGPGGQLGIAGGGGVGYAMDLKRSIPLDYELREMIVEMKKEFSFLLTPGRAVLEEDLISVEARVEETIAADKTKSLLPTSLVPVGEAIAADKAKRLLARTVEEAIAADKAKRLVPRSCQTKARQGKPRWRKAAAAGGEPFLADLAFQAATSLVFAGGKRWGDRGDGGAELDQEEDFLPWGLEGGGYVFFCEGVAVAAGPLHQDAIMDMAIRAPTGNHGDAAE
ncbi:hypothetical protein T484DRAFT_1783347 [Baffinella frigidus]|nr:hypothetical protein T484DRAFT_1783347 [Cryptophyta sp. CCMP2293]